MTYRSVLGPHQQPKALLDSVKHARLGDVHMSIRRGGGLAQNQIINFTPIEPHGGGNTFAVDVTYATSTGDQTTSGISFGVHYDSSKITLVSVINRFESNLAEIITGDDTNDLDSDHDTDKVIKLTWIDEDESWPGSDDVLLCTLLFRGSDSLDGHSTTVVNMSPIQTAAGYGFQADSVPMVLRYGSWDIDGNGKLDALTDGLMFLRFAFGVVDADFLLVGAVDPATSLTSQQILENARFVNRSIGDIDGDGSVDALTDGILLLRYAFDVSPSNLIAGAVSSNGTRTTAEEITAYIEKYLDTEVPTLPELPTVDTSEEEEGTDEQLSLRAVINVPKIVAISNNVKKPVASAAKTKNTSAALTKSLVKATRKKTQIAARASQEIYQTTISYTKIAATFFRPDWLGWQRIGETVVFSEATSMAIAKLVNDSVTINDTVNLRAETQRGFVDEASSSEVLEYAIKYKREAFDQFTLDSFFDTAFFDAKDKSNLAQLSDVATLVAAFKRSISDDFSFSSSAFIRAGKNVADPLSIEDTFTRTVSFIRQNVDAFSYSDAITMAVTKQAEEGMSIGDLHSFDIGSSVVNIFSSAEIVRFSKKYKKFEFDAFKLDDSAKIADQNAFKKDNLASLSDKVSFLSNVKRSIEDSVSFSDPVSISATKALETSFGFSEQVSFFTPYARQFNDSLGLADNSSLKLSKLDSESIGLSDTPFIKSKKPILDVSDVSEIVLSTAKYKRFFFDALTIADIAKLSEGHGEIDSDTATLADTASRQWAATRGFADSSNIDDFFSVNFGKNTDEDISLTDTQIISVGFGRKFIEEASLDDIVTKAIKPAKTEDLLIQDVFSKFIKPKKLDFFGSSEVVSANVRYKRLFGDQFSLTDLLKHSEDNAETATNTATLTDVFTTVSNTKRVFTDTASTSDSLELLFGKAETDSAQLVDTISTITNFNRAIEETPSLVDTNYLTIKKPKNETLTIDDAPSFNLNKPVLDTSNASEVFVSSAKFKRLFADSFTLDDFVIDSEGNYFSKGNVANFTDTVSLQADFVRGFSNSVSFTSNANFGVSKLVKDTASLADTVQTKMAFKSSTSDTFSYTDSITKALKSGKAENVDFITKTSASINKQFVNSTLAREIVTTAASYVRFANDTITALDSVKVAENNAFNGADPASLADDVAFTHNAYRGFLNAFSFATSVSLGLTKQADGDAVSIVDSPELVASYKRSNVDSISYNSVIQKNVGKAPSESLGLASNTILGIAKEITSEASAAELIGTKASYRRAFADVLDVTDIFSRAEDNYLPPENVVAFTDAVTTTNVFKRLVEDEIEFSSTILKQANSQLTESASLADTVILASGLFRTVPDETLSFGDNLILGYGKSQEDAVPLNDQIIKTIKPLKEDDFSANEIVNTAASYRRALEDDFVLLDAAKVAEQNSADDLDTASLQDLVSFEFVANRFKNESISLSQSVAKKLAKYFTATVSLSDTLDSTSLSNVDGYSNSFGVTDVSLLKPGKYVTDAYSFDDRAKLTFGKSESEAFDADEIFTHKISYVRRLSDGFHLDSIVTAAFDTHGSKTNRATITDNVSLQADYIRTQNEQLGFSSVAAIAATKPVSNTIGLTEHVVTSLGVKSDLGVESFEVSDSININYRKSLTDSLNLSDVSTVGGESGLTDSLTTSELISHVISYDNRPSQEAVDFSEDISKLIKISPANNIIGLTDTVTINLTTAAPLGVINTATVNSSVIN